MLKQALTRANDREAALRVLVEMPPSVAMLLPVLPEVLDTAIDSSNLTAIGLAREVLFRYRTEPVIRTAIAQLVTGYLPSHDEWQYRRLAELYVLLRYDEELASFLLLCQASPNAEIQELYDDFCPS
jgi:hypothetical protein